MSPTASPRPGRRLVSVVVSLLLTVCSALATAAPAQAHNVLRSTDPAPGSRITSLPDQIVLTFDEPALAVGTQLEVTGPQGRLAVAAPQLIDNQVRQPIPHGPPGQYTVLWRVSSADGHPVSGTFSFTVDGPARSTGTATDVAGAPVQAAASTEPAPTRPWPILLGAALILVCLVAGALASIRRRSRER